jgi:serine/threonine-protein kinase RsbW
MLRPGTEPDSKFVDSDVYIREDETISEPFDYNELLALAKREFIKFKKAEKFVSHTTQFEIKSLPTAITTANSMLFQFLELSGMSQDDITTFHMAVKEGIDNAYRHGNRKNDSKIIYIGFKMDAQKIKVVIRDEGPGFDFNYYLDASKRLSPEQSARKRHEDGLTGGLGIIMMKKSSDAIEYAKPGNCLTLVKNLRRNSN